MLGALRQVHSLQVTVRRRVVTSGLLWFVVCGLWTAPALAIDHSAWDGLLHRHVKDGRVDYRGVQAERAMLDQYLAAVGAADPSQLPTTQDRLAFWINAYNACVFKGVLDHAPVASVKDVKGFFDGIKHHVAGRELTLNEIEAQERALGDWRGHFGVVCASSSCPPLRDEAYVPERLHAQLTEQVRQFLSDPERGLRVDGATLWVTKIFDWYAADFVQARQLGLLRKLMPAALVSVIAPYLEDGIAQRLAAQPPTTLKFLPYDWTLNAQRRAP